MKKIISILFTINCFAGSYLPKSKVGQDTDGLEIHTKKLKCEKQYGEPCINVRGVEDISASKIRPEKWLKEQADSCLELSVEDCMSKLESYSCDSDGYNPIMVYEDAQKEVYCTKYRPEKIVVDDDKKAIKDAEKAAKKAEKEARKAEVQELKGFIQNINDSDLPNWHKKILKKLVRELKE